MLIEINGRIKIGDDDKVVLEIAQDDLEKFREYEDINWDGTTVGNEFYAGFTLDDEQLYVTGLYPQEEQHGNDIIMYVECAGYLSREIYHYEPQGIKELLCLNGTKVIEATNISKHPLKLKEEKALQEKQDLEAAKEKAETDLQTKTQELENAEKEAEEKQQELQTKLNTADEELKAKENEIKSLKAKINQSNAEVEGLERDLQAKDQEIVKLKKDKEITQLKQQQPDLDAKVLKMQLKAKLERAEEKVKQLQQENKELEAASQGAQNKTIKQPEQSNAAQYAAGVGVGVGLDAWTDSIYCT